MYVYNHDMSHSSPPQQQGITFDSQTRIFEQLAFVSFYKRFDGKALQKLIKNSAKSNKQKTLRPIQILFTIL